MYALGRSFLVRWPVHILMTRTTLSGSDRCAFCRGQRSTGKQYQIMIDKKVDHDAMLVRSTTSGSRSQIGQRGHHSLRHFSPSSVALISAPDYTYVLAQTFDCASLAERMFLSPLTLAAGDPHTRVKQTYCTLRHGAARWRETPFQSCRRRQSSNQGKSVELAMGNR
jgi:hypothetical protein